MLTLLKTPPPIATPPWTALGRRLESMARKCLHDFSMVVNDEPIAVALSGGKDSLTLLFLLKAILGRGFPNAKLIALHVTGAYSCGASINLQYLQSLCDSIEVPLYVQEVKQDLSTLECYSCSRKRRSTLFSMAKEAGCQAVAFGHHKDDTVQTFLMNMLHKGEFAGMLPVVPMHDYGVTILRPLLYISENEIREFAKLYGFARITCQCPVGQNSLRMKTKSLLNEISELYPNAVDNLASIQNTHGLKKALLPTSKKSEPLPE